ncbi:MAG: alpha/beta fold hydrolase [Deltaproteobacteria bacterium]|nr:alpha/beta fold hydrolase [Deltaproteobacteria bacterium]
MIKKFPYTDLLPYQSHYLNIDGYQMHYLDEGSGPVVILVHGNPTWCFYYRHLVETLRHTHRVIVPDHIGCGLSEHPKQVHFRAQDRVQHLEKLIEHLEIKKFSLVMHDWGGPIGTFCALNNVDAIEKLVYLNTTLTETESLPFFIKIAAKPLIGKWFTKHTKRFLKLATAPGLGVMRKLDKRVRKAYIYPYKTRQDRTPIWDFVDDIPFSPRHPTYAHMQSIGERIPSLHSKPVQIIWGLKDPCFHAEMLSQVVKLFPDASVLEIPDASHLVAEDAPELVGTTVLNFLLRDDSSASKQASEQAGGSEKQIGTATSLYEHFLKVADQNPLNDAAIIPRVWGSSVSYKYINYKDMRDLVHRYHRGLCSLGLRTGDKVLFLVKPGIDFLALAYAVMAEGAIPIFIDPGIERKHLFQCLQDIQPDVFIGSQKAHLLRILKKDLFSSVRFHITANDWAVTGGPTLQFLKRYSSRPVPETKYNEIGMIGFTSGATGLPKGVVFTQEMLCKQLEIFREQFKIEPGHRDLPLLPIFSIYQLANGVASVFPPIDPAQPLSLDPYKIVKIISDLKISYSFGSPTLWKKISEYCVRMQVKLPTVKKVFMAGAPVPEDTLKLVRSTLADGEAFTPYGATEALPTTLISATEIIQTEKQPAKGGEQGTLVGKPVMGVEVKIIDPVDGVIEEIDAINELQPYRIGEVIVSGQNISQSYLYREDATRASKIYDDAKIWHRMGDMGYLDNQGRLYFCGRKVHMVKSADRIFYSVPTERVFLQHAKVNRAALVGLVDGSPGIVIEPKPQYWPETPEAINAFFEELHQVAKQDKLTSSIDRFYLHQSFPVDRRHNAKIYRDQLASWANEQDKESTSYRQHAS